MGRNTPNGTAHEAAAENSGGVMSSIFGSSTAPLIRSQTKTAAGTRPAMLPHRPLNPDLHTNMLPMTRVRIAERPTQEASWRLVSSGFWRTIGMEAEAQMRIADAVKTTQPASISRSKSCLVWASPAYFSSVSRRPNGLPGCCSLTGKS